MLSRFGCRILKYLGELGTWEEDGSRKKRERRKNIQDNIPHNTVHIAGCLIKLKTFNHVQTHSKGQMLTEQQSRPGIMLQPCVTSSRAAQHAPCPHTGDCCPPSPRSARHPQWMLQPRRENFRSRVPFLYVVCIFYCCWSLVTAPALTQPHVYASSICLLA